MKTLQVEDDIHLLITEKQTELYRKTGHIIKLSDIVGKIITNGINSINNLYKDKLSYEEEKQQT